MQEDIKALIKGHQKFRAHYFDEGNTTFSELVREGQRPKILMVACCDSRVDPALVMNSQPGDLLVIRNVANLVPPYEEDQSYHGTSAALEFGVCILGIRHVILFGHTQCGGIQALLESSDKQIKKKTFISKWMELARPAHEAILKFHEDKSLEDKTTLCGQYSLVNSLKNLETFPWIAERVHKGLLSLHAWNFNLSRGILERYNPEKNKFEDLNNEV